MFRFPSLNTFWGAEFDASGVFHDMSKKLLKPTYLYIYITGETCTVEPSAHATVKVIEARGTQCTYKAQCKGKTHSLAAWPHTVAPFDAPQQGRTTLCLYAVGLPCHLYLKALGMRRLLQALSIFGLLSTQNASWLWVFLQHCAQPILLIDFFTAK